jgi:hypothetical protein
MLGRERHRAARRRERRRLSEQEQRMAREHRDIRLP